MNALADIASRAAEKHLPWLLAGGHAVIAHGYPRSTFDVDIIVRRTDEESWVELVRGLGYVFFHKGPTFLQFNAPNAQSFPLDIMLTNDETFEKLSTEAVPAPSNTGNVRVVSLLHLLALKCHAIRHGHAGRIVKDADDVIRLVQANRLNLNGSKNRELFLKYGTLELYEKIKHACGQN